MILLTGLAVQTINISKSWSSVVLPESIHTRNYINLTRFVPLPYDIDEMAYEPFLDHLHDSERLRSLVQSQSRLSLSVKATNRELTKLLVCALKRDSRADSDDKESEFALLNNIVTLVRKQVQHTVSNASGLNDLYTSIKLAYHAHNLTVAEALETTQLDDHENFLVAAQPIISRWMGRNYKKQYWDPWIEKREKLEGERSEIESGMVALEKILGRLGKIERVAQEVDGNLEHFVTLILTDVEFNRDGGNLLRNLLQRGYALIQLQLEGGQSGEKVQKDWPREKAQKDWFQQHVSRDNFQDEEPVSNSSFDAWWTNLNCR